MQSADGIITDYGYDEVGNRLVKAVYSPPTANFTASAVIGYGPLFSVTFTDSSTGNPASWLWDFGDNSGTNSQQNPTHAYNNLGSYTVSLTVSNPAGSNAITKTSYITVQSCPNSSVRIVGDPNVYTTLQAAYNAAANGNVIQAQARVFTENLTAGNSNNISITLDGGYLCDFSSNPGATSLQGVLTISNGTVTIKNFALQK